MKVNTKIDALKKDTLDKVADILELVRYANGADIEIHLCVDEAPRVTYKIIGEIIREKETDGKALIKELGKIVEFETELLGEKKG